MTPTQTLVLMDHLLIGPSVTSLLISFMFVLNSKALPPFDTNLSAVFSMST